MEWIFETIALSVITLLLLLLMLTRKGGWTRLLLGILTTVSALASLTLFILMQHAAGNPAAGHEALQLYLPCGVYAVIAIWGALSAVFSWQKLQKAKLEKKASRSRKEEPRPREGGRSGESGAGQGR